MAGVCLGLEKIPKCAKRLEARPADDDVVQDLNLQELAGPDQIPRHLDVRLARRRIPARVIVLCEASSYVQRTVGGTGITRVFREEGMPWIHMNHPSIAIPAR